MEIKRNTVGRRLQEIGKLYEAKKEIMRERHQMAQKQQEDQVISVAKKRHKVTDAVPLTDRSVAKTAVKAALASFRGRQD